MEYMEVIHRCKRRFQAYLIVGYLIHKLRKTLFEKQYKFPQKNPLECQPFY